MDVSIVIVNWNSRDHLKNCIGSIIEHTEGVDYEVIVIDAASFDGCDVMLEATYPTVAFIQAQTNSGFAKSNNMACRGARGEYVLFLNPDTEFDGPVVKKLVECMRQRTDVAAVGCRLLNTDRSVQISCVQSLPTILNQIVDSSFLRRAWPSATLWGMAPLFAANDKAAEVEAISGACLMVRRRVFEEVNGFSEEYFMYAEDIDLAYKIRAAGYKNWYTGEVAVIHHGGNSSNQAGSTFSAVMMREATWRFLLKTRGKAYATAYRAAMFCAAVARLGVLGPARLFATSETAKRLRRASQVKWGAVLRWSLHKDATVKRFYYPAA
jgi:N-acetylglucosaminyl-diphospho-decaprenol L-rhamnosyltransferase